MKLTMFHKPKPRQYNYTPIYSKETPKNNADEQESIGDRIRSQWKKSPTSRKKKGVNIVMYLVIAILILYFIFFI